MEERVTAERPMALPEGLRDKLRDKLALWRAVERGYITPMADHWEWRLGSKRLLAYLAGRLWCGDCPYRLRNSDKPIWRQGAGRFPDKGVAKLFRVGSLRTLRKNSFFMTLPKDFEKIDSLFIND